jgi:hypothetical protein
MKNRKWLTYTLGTLLTLVILAAVGIGGFRIGMMQNASFARPAFARNFDDGRQPMQWNFQDGGNQANQGNSQKDGNPQFMQGNPHDNRGPQAMHENFQNRGFGNRGNNRDGGMRFFSPIFGLIHLIVLGLLLWVVYKLVKKSGWRLTRVQTASPAPMANETSNVVVEEKKESE